MHLTVYADFTCPLSFLAHQRVERLVAQGIADVTWHVVVGDRARPVTGQRLDEDAVSRLRAVVQEWTAADEVVPAVPATLSHAGPLTAAYAESVTDGVERELRGAVMHALWVEGQDLSDAVDVRAHVARVMNADHQADNWRRTLSVMPLGIGPDEAMRRAGGTPTRLGSPVTTVGYRRMHGSQHGWGLRGSQALPLVVTDLGEALPAVAGLQHLLSLAQEGRDREPSWLHPGSCPAVPAGTAGRRVAFSLS